MLLAWQEGPPVIRQVSMALAFQGCGAKMCGARQALPIIGAGVLGPQSLAVPLHCLAAESCFCCCGGRMSSLAPHVSTHLPVSRLRSGSLGAPLAAHAG